MKPKAVFLDRDGTLIVDQKFAFDPHRIQLTPDSPAALRRLQEAGYRLIVVTNQSGVARGYFDEEAVRTMHRHVGEALRAQGVEVEAFYYCPHHPEGQVREYAVECECRKPRPGLILRAGRELGLDLGASWLVGDILDDVIAGQRAGCRTVLLVDGAGAEKAGGNNMVQPEATQPTVKAHDLLAAAGLILSREERETDGERG